MTHSFAYSISKGHIIVTSDDGKTCLIDTGSHVSVGDSESLLFAGTSHALNPSLMGRAAHELTGPIGVRIDVLVGADILNRYDMLIDPVRQVLEFSEEEHDVEGETLSIELLSGVPVQGADLGGKHVRVFFDTGVPVCYAQEEILQAFPRVGTANDFYITCGAFQTSLYRVPVTLGSRCLVLDIGALPPDLQKRLSGFGVEGIFGTALLEHFIVSYQQRRKRILLIDRG